MEMDSLALASNKSLEQLYALPPIIGEEERLALLTEMVQRFYQKSNRPLKTSQASHLASHLIQLLNQVQTEGLDFHALKELVPEDYATHWQITLEFLEVIDPTGHNSLHPLEK